MAAQPAGENVIVPPVVVEQLAPVTLDAPVKKTPGGESENSIWTISPPPPPWEFVTVNVNVPDCPTLNVVGGDTDFVTVATAGDVTLTTLNDEAATLTLPCEVVAKNAGFVTTPAVELTAAVVEIYVQDELAGTVNVDSVKVVPEPLNDADGQQAFPVQAPVPVMLQRPEHVPAKLPQPHPVKVAPELAASPVSEKLAVEENGFAFVIVTVTV